MIPPQRGQLPVPLGQLLPVIPQLRVELVHQLAPLRPQVRDLELEGGRGAGGLLHQAGHLGRAQVQLGPDGPPQLPGDPHPVLTHLQALVGPHQAGHGAGVDEGGVADAAGEVGGLDGAHHLGQEAGGGVAVGAPWGGAVAEAASACSGSQTEQAE